MKKIATFLFVLIATSIMAQKEIRNADGSYFKQCSSFQISRPLSELAKEHPAVKKTGVHQEAKDAERKRLWKQPSTVPFSDDPIAQREQGTQAPLSTTVNVDGENSSAGYDPLDPNGMVGPNHYVQAINSNYQVFDKTG